MEKWSKEKIGLWWESQKWPMGCNFVPTCAVNDVEMWMRDTFQADVIARELGWARESGMNTIRVFLSHTVWQAEREAFEDTFERFLSLAQAAELSVMPVLFDDCAFDFGSQPVYGPQKDPVPGVHNSRWVPSPGFDVQDSDEGLDSCREYIRAIVGAHARDGRILAWDVYNEPGNSGRREKCLPLLTLAFLWTREMNPSQPLTAGAWTYGREAEAMNRAMWEMSDVISLHAYMPLAETEAIVEKAERYGRPIFVTEWMHRPAGSQILTHLPYFCRRKIGVWQWGLAIGRTQTHLSWNTMSGGEADANPAKWQHDILYGDGTPYCREEIEMMRNLTGGRGD